MHQDGRFANKDANNWLNNTQLSPHVKLINLLRYIYWEHFTPKSAPKYSLIRHQDSDGLHHESPSISLTWSNTGYSINMLYNLTESIFEEHIYTLFSMELDELAGVRLLIHNKSLYYEVIQTNSTSTNPKDEKPKKSKITTKIAEIPFNEWIQLSLTHDRRLYGESLLFLSINNGPTKQFKIDFPRVRKKGEMSMFSIGGGLIGWINHFMYFETPVEVNKHLELNRALESGFENRSDLGRLGEFYGLDLKHLRCFLAPFCRVLKRSDLGCQAMICPFSGACVLFKDCRVVWEDSRFDLFAKNGGFCQFLVIFFLERKSGFRGFYELCLQVLKLIHTFLVSEETKKQQGMLDNRNFLISLSQFLTVKNQLLRC